MDGSGKIKISSDQILIKAILIIGLFVCLLLLQDYNVVSFKVFTGYIYCIIALTLLLVYFFTRAAVFFDTSNLYIKKVSKPEIVVPLKNIKSINEDFFSSVSRPSFDLYCVKYFLEPKKVKKIKFYVGMINTEKLKQFISTTKRLNPLVDTNVY